jgi:hypothetical protein
MKITQKSKEGVIVTDRERAERLEKLYREARNNELATYRKLNEAIKLLIRVQSGGNDPDVLAKRSSDIDKFLELE